MRKSALHCLVYYESYLMLSPYVGLTLVVLLLLHFVSKTDIKRRSALIV